MPGEAPACFPPRHRDLTHLLGTGKPVVGWGGTRSTHKTPGHLQQSLGDEGRVVLHAQSWWHHTPEAAGSCQKAGAHWWLGRGCMGWPCQARGALAAGLKQGACAKPLAEANKPKPICLFPFFFSFFLNTHCNCGSSTTRAEAAQHMGGCGSIFPWSRSVHMVGKMQG